MSYVVGKPKMFDEAVFRLRVDDILATGQFGNNGKYVKQLEDAYLDFTGCKFAIVVTSATVALELLINYLMLTARGRLRIAVPSFTFVATASCAKRFGHELVFTDSDWDFNMDIGHLLELHNQNPINVAVIPELFGNKLNRDVSFLKKDYGIEVIWDRAHALGIPANKGLAQVYSHHPTKITGAFELGVITTDNVFLARYLESVRNFGFDPSSTTEPNVILLGTNAKASEIAAAGALTQIENFAAIRDHYQSIYYRYVEEFKQDKNCRIFIQNIPDSNYSYVIAFVKKKQKLQKYLEARNIFPKPYFRPIHHFDEFETKQVLFCAETLYRNVLALPSGLTLGHDDVKIICNTIKEFYVNAG